MSHKRLHTAEDGIKRCWWGSDHLDYRLYHDEEWGHPVTDDYQLFEKICLEGFQSGLSWLTILRKRDNFRKAFVKFNFKKVAQLSEKDVKRLLKDEGIIRHQGKIEATINNANRALELVEEFGSLAAYIWQWEPKRREPQLGEDKVQPNAIISMTKTSKALSQDLKKRGWKFFGPTTAYAFMQAMGLVNDHQKGCASYKVVESLRKKLKRPC